ncbi:hypothetical protein [Enterovibrio norvegicus]|uniref:hypothetical protein n=1 Tax=Enterovibrio norvegicus TaxID=188144 RepID=UPI000C84B500|nr:hypothetical protein [Enterovibrio norvegicus]PMH68374.1 hypothetical protein BCU62_00675 [Enterovibrio norvegicus]
MLKRRFYRLDEISDVTPLTKGDLLYAVEQGQLLLFAKINGKGLAYCYSKVIDGYKKTLGDIFDYDGVVVLSKKDSQRASNEPKLDLDKVLIAQPELATNWRLVSDVFPSAKTSGFFVANVAPLSKLPTKPFFAVGEVVERPSGLEEAVKKEIERDNTGEGFLGALELFSKAFVGMKEKQLGTVPTRVNKADLRFDLKEVNKVFGLETTKDGLQSQKVVDTSDVETHPIKIMINRVLLGNATVDTRTIWNVIKRDHQADTREIDLDSLISDMNNDEIEWFGQENTVRTMKYKTFKNYVTTAKNNQN